MMTAECCVECSPDALCDDCRFRLNGELRCEYCGLIYLALNRDDPCECLDGDLHLELQHPKSQTMRRVATEACERCQDANARFDYPVGNSTVRVCSACWTVLNGRPWKLAPMEEPNA